MIAVVFELLRDLSLLICLMNVDLEQEKTLKRTVAENSGLSKWAMDVQRATE
jgi:hypothetical protein